MRVQGFLIYRIWYGDCLVYVGRTKQPLQSRIRGHLFSKPMHRTINIEQATKIEYAELGSEADMNLYEIYYILRLHPPLNVDDKARDDLSVTLPELEWKEFTTPLWEGWRQEIAKQDSRIDHLRKRYAEIPQETPRPAEDGRNHGIRVRGTVLCTQRRVGRGFRGAVASVKTSVGRFTLPPAYNPSFCDVPAAPEGSKIAAMLHFGA